MTAENADILINKIKNYLYTRNSSLTISITGGEPFKNFDILIKLYSELIQLPLKDVSINTNLTADIELIQKLEKYKKENTIGLFISVPSMIKKIYNKITNSNNYDKFIEALKYVNSKPEIFECTANIVLNDVNVKTALKSLKLMNLIGINQFKLAPLKSKKSSNKIIKESKNLIEYSKEIEMVFFGFSTPFMISERQKKNKDYLDIKEYDLKKCGAGNTFFSITPDGYLKPCGALNESTKYFNIFKINDELIPEIIKSNYYSLACIKKCEECTNP